MKELIEIQSELKAPKNQYNSFGKYKYRNCEDILEALKPILSKKNCFVILSDDIVHEGGKNYVRATATIYNKERQSISVSAYAREPEQKKGMDDSQITGAASSYARKYALNGLFAIDDTKDADTKDNSSQPTPKQDEKLMTDEQRNRIINLLNSDKVSEDDQAKGLAWLEGKRTFSQASAFIQRLKS